MAAARESDTRTTGPKEQAWRESGFAVVAEDDEREPLDPVVMWFPPQPPILTMPAWVDGRLRDLIFGWAMVDFHQQARGLQAIIDRARETATACAALLGSCLLG